MPLRCMWLKRREKNGFGDRSDGKSKSQSMEEDVNEEEDAEAMNEEEDVEEVMDVLIELE